MDQFLQPPGTPYGERYFERRIDALLGQMQPDVALDAARWQMSWGTPQTFTQALQIIKSDYLQPRRVHLYQTHGREGVIPDAQPAKTDVRFGAIEFDPPSGKQDQEYLTLVNDNDYAVDISGWQIAYDVEHVFQPGVVIPARGTLYVSPDVVAFRDRAASPRGGEGLLVQGNYRGRLSNRWGALRLYDAQGKLVTTRTFINPHLLERESGG
jgi:hypothetical protein